MSSAGCRSHAFALRFEIWLTSLIISSSYYDWTRHSQQRLTASKTNSATISWEMNLSKSTIKLSVTRYPTFGEEKQRELTILIITNRVFSVIQSRFLALFFGFFRRARSLQSSRLRKKGEEVTKKGKKYCNHKNIAQSYKSFLKRIPCPVKPLTAQQELQLYLMTSLHQLLTRGL